MPIAESDHFIAELGRLCSGQKTRGEVKLGTHEVVLSRKPNHITISKNTTWSPYHLNYNIETVRRAVERYMQKRQNYADDGHYRMPVDRL